MLRSRFAAGTFAFLCAVFASVTPVTPAYSQTLDVQTPAPSGPSDIAPQRVPVSAGQTERTDSIMQRQALAPPAKPRPDHEFDYPDRSTLPDNPMGAATASYPASPATNVAQRSLLQIHTTQNSFDGASLTDTGAFPPDSMGTAGPTQFVVFVNGRMRSFTKAGVADNVLNANPDVFFASVETPVGGSVVQTFTSDPQIRYDRFTGRWFMSIIDVPCTNATCTTVGANRWLLAVSDAASNGTISASTVWTFSFVSVDATNFCDYPSLGIDINALYFGCNMFSPAGAFAGTNGYVVQKVSATGAGPLIVTKFANLVSTPTGAGAFAPRGVDNFDANATTGYFIGVDNASFGTLALRRVTNPGSATPTISPNISIATPSNTRSSNPVEHLGNTGGTNGNLDALDDRLYQAMIRNGSLWTAHNIRVNPGGAASTATNSRNAARWYQLQDLDTTPTFVQSGTVNDSAGTRAAALQYFIPSIAANGQGHAVIGFTQAGAPSGATPAYTGRLASDAAGTMAGVPGTGVTLFGVTTHNYNPASDPGGASGRRWGDYSFTVVDPIDDMTIWTIQEYNEASNLYAVRVGRLQAPPPATPSCATATTFSNGTGNVTINATSSNGSGFYDPGTNLPAPARPFSHLSASVSGGVTVNSATYNSPTQVTLNITTTTSGLKNVTITNPDGQSVTGTSCINVIGPPTHLVFTTQPSNGTAGQTLASVAVTVEDAANNVMTTDNSTQVTLSLSSNTLNGTLTQTAVNGVATFSNLSINTAGTGYTLGASSSPPLTSATSNAFDIAAGAPNQLAFLQQPGTTAAGAAISPAITVQVLDAFGNLTADTSAVTLGIGTNPSGGTLSGTATVNAVAGVATFSTLSIDKAGVGYTLAASDGALAGASSNAFTIVPAAAASLAFGTQPSDTTAGNAIAPAVTVQLFDAFGNLASNDNASQVSVGVASGPGTLSGGSAVSVVNGIATFPNLVLTSAGLYQLSANSGVLPTATSSNFTVNPASGNALVFIAQPSNTVAGASILPPVQVQLQDQFGNALNDSGIVVTLSANGPGGIVSGGTTNTLAGIATFSGITIDVAGNYSLSANSTGYTQANSNAFTIAPGAATQLVYTTQPASGSDVVAGTSIDLVVQVQDAFGNVVTTDASTVSLAIGNNPGSATLGGTGSTSAVAGVATFTGLGVNLNKVGSGYTLVASDSGAGVTNATSNAFNIVPAAATHLGFVQQPGNVTAGATLAPAVTVEVLDDFGNRVTASSASIALAPASGPGSLTGGGAVAASAGLATFGALSLQTAGSYTLGASSTGLTGATSASFQVTPAALDHLAFTTQPPASIAAGGSFGVAVQLQDAFNNALTGDTGTSVTLALGANPGGDSYAGASTTDSAGNASFSGVSLSKAASGYTLTASAGGKNGSSNAFTVLPGALDHIAVTTQPPATAQSGNAFSVSAELRDAFNNVLSNDNSDTMTLALSSNPGGDSYSGGSTTVTAGAATFSVTLTKQAAGYVLQFGSGSAVAQTNAFAVVPSTGILLAFVTQPADVTRGLALGTVSVEERDAFGNRVTADSSTVVTLSTTLCGNPTTLRTATLSNGLATFNAPASGFHFYSVASGLQLSASGGSLTSGTSNAFNVVASSDIAFTDGFEICRP